MKVKDIDLKHFTIQLERAGSLINTTVIRIRSKPEYVDNYKDSHGEPIKLSFTLQTNMHLRFTEKTKKVILSFLPTEEIYRLKDSIAYRLSNIIKERDIQLYSTQNEILANETSKHKENKELNLSELEANKTSLTDENKVNLDDLFSGDFNFDDEPSENENIPILTDFASKDEVTETSSKLHVLDEYGFNELDVKDIAPKLASDLNLSDDFDFEDEVLSKDFNSEDPITEAKHLNDEFDFSEFDDVVTSDFEEILEKNTPVEARPINELIESLLSSKQQLDNNYKLFTIMANAAARFEQRSKSIELTVANLERELLNALQNKYK